MNSIKPKKSLGQHFLVDQNIARKIVGSLSFQDYNAVIEIGPGTGILTEYLLALENKEVKCIEIDQSSVDHLLNKFPGIQGRIFTGNVLTAEFTDFFTVPFAVIGNLPYNISSQVFFKLLEYRNLVRETVCMVQKEVAQRIISPPGSKEYGILSVLLQTFYHIEHLFNVGPKVFNPPPKVNSSVIRLKRNMRATLECDESVFFHVVKTAFNQRRKMIRNSLKSMIMKHDIPDHMLQFRPEQLEVEDFIRLTCLIENNVHL